MKNRSEAFGRLLKAGIGSIVTCEGKKAPVVEDDLGAQIGVSADAIQRYKAGALPPDPRTVQILAEACVRRGMMGREWLEAFLHAARYHQADRLLDQLRPLGPARPRPPRVYENLPAPTYSQFVMRPQAFTEVADGLGKRTAIVLIIGLGGNGKTSLAREVAARCLRDDDEAPRFDAVVWVSDKDRPGTTNLSTVLNEIARTLDYPGFTQFEHDEKRREVEQLLRRQRVLLVVDNFETITDGALLTWLINLPEPSKALITTREYRREFRRNGWPVELRGMSKGEIRILIDQRLRQLRIEKLAGDLEQLEPLITATGGNPKAIEITLGLVKHERRPLQQMVDDLYAARGDLFDDLFARAWALLDEAAMRVLMVATFFPASASGEALGASADVQGFAFDRAVERLADLALLDVQQEDLNSHPRYVLHPLVRAFAWARMAEKEGFELGARECWVVWFLQLLQGVGRCWDDLSRLQQIDAEQETALLTIEWCFKYQRYLEALQIGDVLQFYYYSRGLWHQNQRVNRIRIDSARALDCIAEEAESLGHLIWVLSYQSDTQEARQLVARLRDLLKTNSFPPGIFFMTQLALGIYHMAREEFNEAQQIWENSISTTQHLEAFEYISNLQWLASARYQKGEVIEAKRLFHGALSEALRISAPGHAIFNRLQLASISIEEGDLEQASYLLNLCDLHHEHQTRTDQATIQNLTARLHTLRGDIPAARAARAEAIDLFERLGMRRELAEARADLARLESAGASEADAPTT